MPAANEQDPKTSQLSTFPVSPTAAPQHITSPEGQGKQRYPSSVDAPSPLDLRPNPGHLDSPEVRNRQRIDASMDPNSPSNLALRQHEQQLEQQYHHEPAPIEVDFTGYRLDQRQDSRRRPSSHPQQHLPSLSGMDDPSLRPADPMSLAARLSPLPNSSSRKRSYDNAERDNPSPSTPQSSSTTKRLSSISSLLNHPQSATDDMPIDPTLSTIGQQQLPLHRHSHPDSQPHRYQLPPPDGRPRQSTSSDPGGWEIRERKARLRREAEQIREMLRTKEREIEELDGEG